MEAYEKLLQEVRALNEEKEYNKVIDILTIHVLEKYNKADLYAEKAMTYWIIKDYKSCEQMALKTIELDDKNAIGYHYLGNCYSKKKYIDLP